MKQEKCKLPGKDKDEEIQITQEIIQELVNKGDYKALLLIELAYLKEIVNIVHEILKAQK